MTHDMGFVRTTMDSCVFTRVYDEAGAKRVTVGFYVDDGRTWNTVAARSHRDAFYDALEERFKIRKVNSDFFLGMDIVDRTLSSITLSSLTFIMALFEKVSDKPLSAYKQFHTPADPRLMDFYEAAFQLHIIPSITFVWPKVSHACRRACVGRSYYAS